jgi:hypothetical protein
LPTNATFAFGPQSKMCRKALLQLPIRVSVNRRLPTDVLLGS